MPGLAGGRQPKTLLRSLVSFLFGHDWINLLSCACLFPRACSRRVSKNTKYRECSAISTRKEASCPLTTGNTQSFDRKAAVRSAFGRTATDCPSGRRPAFGPAPA
jgi:hypothetical protein